MRLTIKARLILAFSVLICLTGGIFYLGNSNSFVLNDKITEIIKVNTRRIQLAGKIAEDVQFITKREKDLILTKQADELQALAKDIDDRNALLNERVEQIRGIADAKGLEILDDFTGKWNEYSLNLNRIRTLAININTDSSNAVAYEVSRTTAKATALEAITIINKIVKKNEAELEQVDRETNELYASGKNSMMGLLALSVVMAAAISYWIITSIARSITRAQQAIKAVAEGDLTVSIDVSSRDEIGEMMVLLQNMVDKLKEVIGFVSVSTANIASASEQMAASSQQVSQGATEQASSSEEVSASMEQMAANILQNTDNAQQTEKIALQASEDIKEGNGSVNQTVESMKTIAEKITIIGEIARQTNLLALNAAVEAARAGEHGKGFAVVASEVRKLAERSQLAANEIDVLSRSSVAVAEKSGKLLEQIVPNIQKTSRLVQEIAAASIEQNAGADQVNKAIQQLSQVIQQNAAASEEMAASSVELSSQAEQLQETISFFKVDTHPRSSHGRTNAPKGKKSTIRQVAAAKPAPKSHGQGVQLKLHHDALDEAFEKY
jgi:methyl-accepting chemotaxis protein